MKKLMVLVTLVSLTVNTFAFHPNNDCDTCHIPHNATSSLSGIPLWSGRSTTTTAFTNYDSPSLDATTGDPEGSTLLCLSCHDSGDGHKYLINTTPGDLGGTHPIEFVYDTALSVADKELIDPASAGSSTVVLGQGTIAADLLAADTGKMNCISCHEIHANGLHGVEVTIGTGSVESFDIPHLVNIPGITYTQSYGTAGTSRDDYKLSYGALCTTCHIK